MVLLHLSQEVVTFLFVALPRLGQLDADVEHMPQLVPFLAVAVVFRRNAEGTKPLVKGLCLRNEEISQRRHHIAGREARRHMRAEVDLGVFLVRAAVGEIRLRKEVQQQLLPAHKAVKPAVEGDLPRHEALRRVDVHFSA